MAVSIAAMVACTGPADPAGDGGDESTGSDSSSDAGDESTNDDGSTTDTGSEESTDEGESEGPFPEDPPTVLFPRTRIAKEELAVLVNDDDDQSVAVAEYYVMAREIPEQNVVHLSFPPGSPSMSSDAFGPLKDQVDAALGDDIQALAITWTDPYRVGCMSVTSAFAFGYASQWCHTGGGCSETALSPYYDSESLFPKADHDMRPGMMLAGETAEDVFALIDRGIASDSTHPTGDGYFVRTDDSARNVRWMDFLATIDHWDHEGGLDMFYIDNWQGNGSNALTDTDDVLFYFTGLVTVPDIDTNTYLPGCIADHLTSTGGKLTDSSQMSILRWLEAGATASFGTVREPCNFTTKFPSPIELIGHYFRGQTVVEAYWKSVAWPGEGVFVGEPLAAPWDGSFVDYDPDTGLLEITTNLLRPKTNYDVESAPSEDGPWTTVHDDGQVPYEQTLTIPVEEAREPFYRIIESE